LVKGLFCMTYGERAINSIMHSRIYLVTFDIYFLKIHFITLKANLFGVINNASVILDEPGYFKHNILQVNSLVLKIIKYLCFGKRLIILMLASALYLTLIYYLLKLNNVRLRTLACLNSVPL
jgi:hypothetical protein